METGRVQGADPRLNGTSLVTLTRERARGKRNGANSLLTAQHAPYTTQKPHLLKQNNHQKLPNPILRTTRFPLHDNREPTPLKHPTSLPPSQQRLAQPQKPRSSERKKQVTHTRYEGRFRKLRTGVAQLPLRIAYMTRCLA